MKNTKNLFLLSRPYSWVMIILVGLMAHVSIKGVLEYGTFLITDILISLLIWFFSAFTNEYLHRRVDGRDVNRVKVILAAILLIILVLMLYRNYLAVAILPVIFTANLIYSAKVKNWFFNSYSFIVRGFLEILVFITILIFYGVYSIQNYWLILLVIFLVTDSRNLIGDIRDVKFDKYTFPKKYGITASYVVSIILLLTSLMLIPDLMINFPLILILLSIPFLYRNPYDLHRLYMLASTLFFLNYIIFIVNQTGLLFANILSLAIFLNFTYPFVPRRCDSGWKYAH